MEVDVLSLQVAPVVGPPSWTAAEVLEPATAACGQPTRPLVGVDAVLSTRKRWLSSPGASKPTTATMMTRLHEIPRLLAREPAANEGSAQSVGGRVTLLLDRAHRVGRRRSGRRARRPRARRRRSPRLGTDGAVAVAVFEAITCDDFEDSATSALDLAQVFP